MFSSVRRRDMLKNSINTHTTAFSTSYNGAMAGFKNDDESVNSAFRTDVQGGLNMKFNGGSQRHSLSDFQSRGRDDIKVITNRKISSKLKNIISKFHL